MRLKHTRICQLRCESLASLLDRTLIRFLFLVILAEDVFKREGFQVVLVKVMQHAWDRVEIKWGCVLLGVQVGDLSHDLHGRERFDRTCLNESLEGVAGFFTLVPWLEAGLHPSVEEFLGDGASINGHLIATSD